MRLAGNLDCSRYDYARDCVNKYIGGAPNTLVFDIGAGSAIMSPACAEVGAVWMGFDVNPQSPDVNVWNFEKGPCPESKKAGTILLLDVIEHLSDPWQGMRHCIDCLEPGGYVVLTAPNPRWSRSRWLAVFHGVPACFTEDDLERNHHVFTTWPHIVEKLLEDVGCAVLEYVTLDGHTTWPGLRRSPPWPHRYAFAAMNKMIEIADPTACGMSYGVVARKEDKSLRF